MVAGNNNGRPLKFKDVNVLKQMIDDYFESCFEMKWFDEDYRDENGNREKVDGVYRTIPVKKKVMEDVPTVSGLACALGTSRRTLVDYQKQVHDGIEDDRFSHTIKEAKHFIENCHEKGLMQGKLNTTGTIFSLKNNYDWKDKIETDVKLSGGVENFDLKDLTTEELLARKAKQLKKDGQKEENQ